MNSSSQNDKPSAVNSAVGESISALLDNQGDELDLRRVLKESEADDSVRATWQRYHIASAVMKNENSVLMGLDLSAQIRAELDLEPAHSLPATKAKRTWLDVMAKSSIAATVALGLLVGVQQFSGNGFTAPNGAGTAELAELEPFVAPDLNSAVVPAGFDTPTLSARTVSTAQRTQSQPLPLPAVTKPLPKQGQGASLVKDPELQAHFDRLMMIHAKQVSDSSDLGVMSFARLTDLDAEAVTSQPEALSEDATEAPIAR